jgi:predicted nucleotidyltransferase
MNQAKLSKEEILKRLTQHKSELQNKYPIASLALFGSYARGDENEISDIDIMIDLKEPMGWELVDVLEYFEKIFPEKKVDMVTKGGVKNSRYNPFIEEDLIYV